MLTQGLPRRVSHADLHVGIPAAPLVSCAKLAKLGCGAFIRGQCLGKEGEEQV